MRIIFYVRDNNKNEFLLRKTIKFALAPLSLLKLIIRIKKL